MLQVSLTFSKDSKLIVYVVIASYHFFNFFIHLHFWNCRHKNLWHESLWSFRNDTVPAFARNVNLKIFVSFTSIPAVSCLFSLKNKLVNLQSNESVCAQVNCRCSLSTVFLSWFCHWY